MINTAIRTSISTYISQNPYTIVAYVRTKVDNGYGVMVPDLTITPTATTLGIARISRRRLPEPIVANAKTPYDYQDVYYLQAAYDADWLHKGIVFEYNGLKYRTGRVENKIVGGAVAYKISDLEEITSTDVGDFYV